MGEKGKNQKKTERGPHPEKYLSKNNEKETPSRRKEGQNGGS